MSGTAEVESWRSKADVFGDCLWCSESWVGKNAYRAARRHAEKTGHEVHVEVAHTVVYKGVPREKS